MCHILLVNFQQCGHRGEIHYKVCESPSTCGDPQEIETLLPHFGNFCPQCFMLLDSNSLLNGAGPNNFGHPLSDIQLAEIENIWRRAEKHMQVNDTDLLALVGTHFERLSLHNEDLEAFYSICSLLIDEFWWRLKHPEMTQPTKSQRIFILQLQRFEEFTGTEAEYEGDLMSKKFTALWKTDRRKLFTKVHITEENSDCSICQEPFDEDVECPVSLPCNHQFGEKCIQRWLEDSQSCPLCRQTFKPPVADKDAFAKLYLEQIQAERATWENETPTWLLMLTGCESSEYMKQEAIQEIADGEEDEEDQVHMEADLQDEFQTMIRELDSMVLFLKQTLEVLAATTRNAEDAELDH